MLAESSYYQFTLGPGEALSLRRTAGWEIVCLEGRVWLTEEAGGADIWLVKGERMVLSRGGRTVIEAERGTMLRMCLPPSRWRQTLAAAVAVLARRWHGGIAMRPPAAPGRI